MRGCLPGLLWLLFALPALADDAAQALTPHAIDEALSAEAARRGVTPAAPADPGAFARRLALDSWGTLPDPQRVAEVRRGLLEPAVWIQEALDDPRFVTYAAERLGQAWWPLAAGDDANVQLLREDFVGWLEGRLRAGAGLDALAAEVLAAEGTTDANPALSFLVRFGATGAADAAGPVARRFLGLSWDCARCHDHPFGPATQRDFHALAAFFGRLRVRAVPGRQLVFAVGEAPLGEHRATLGEEREEVAPAFPAAPDLAGGSGPGRANEASRRARFARWLGDSQNPFFARAQVNRVWRDLFGRPLVSPVDELDLAPDDAHAQLLEEVAAGFAANGYSLRWLYRTLLSTVAYARALDGDGARVQAFVAAGPRPLTRATRARMLLRVVGRERPREGELPRLRAALTRRVRSLFAEEPLAGELLPGQALVQLSDPGLLGLLAQAESRYPQPPQERLQAIYWTGLGRAPSPAEREALSPALEERTGLVDVLWAVVSSTEFGCNH